MINKVFLLGILSVLALNESAEAQTTRNSGRPVSQNDFIEFYTNRICGMRIEEFAASARSENRRILERSGQKIVTEMTFNNANRGQESFRVELQCESRVENGASVLSIRETVLPIR